jgi:hypothetical protein
MTKLPEPPSVSALREVSPDVDVLPAGSRIYRVYFRGGRYPSSWNRARAFGPIPGARFDHHIEPAKTQERAIMYAATNTDAVATCVAEVFQDTRLVDTGRRAPWLACFALTRDVPLLSLRGKWRTRAGASTNINSGPRPRCRGWSSTIYEAYPDLQGLLYASSMNANEPALALYERAASALPTSPLFNRPLSDPALLVPLERIAAELGYDLF